MTASRLTALFVAFDLRLRKKLGDSKGQGTT